MATASEIQSLDDIIYKSRLKLWMYPFIFGFIFVFGFLNYYPTGDKFKTFLKKNLQGSACNLDYNEIRLEFLLPKLIVSDLTIPASCLNRTGEALRFTHLTINFQFISFAPFGIPFRIDTETNGQPITLYFVQGFGKRMVRLKDQTLVLNRLQPLLGGKLKMNGKVKVDLAALMSSDNSMQELSLKVQSKDFQLPSQSIENFTVPVMKINDLYIEANTENPPRVTVDKMILGDTDSPMRANFKGKIDLQQGNVGFSSLSLDGEIAFSDNFVQTAPWIEMLFQTYPKKDSFYQLRIGGTLGQPKMMNR